MMKTRGKVGMYWLYSIWILDLKNQYDGLIVNGDKGS